MCFWKVREDRPSDAAQEGRRCRLTAFGGPGGLGGSSSGKTAQRGPQKGGHFVRILIGLNPMGTIGFKTSRALENQSADY